MRKIIGLNHQTRIVLLWLLGAVFCVSIFLAASELLDAHRSAQAFEDLAESVFMTPPMEETAVPDRNFSATTNREETAAPDTANWEKEQLARYTALKEGNPDFFGWIYIEGTQINYPVMHTPDDPEYYLRRAMDGSYSISGVPFLDGACYEGCGNYIVYGHHMNEGTMFADLLNYANQEFWEEHPTLRFDTLDALAGYEIVAAFYSKAYTSKDQGVFRYYQYNDLTEPAVFEEFVTRLKAAALYDTGIVPEYGDQLLTLSTCNYHTNNGRFVVAARKIR